MHGKPQLSFNSIKILNSSCMHTRSLSAIRKCCPQIVATHLSNHIKIKTSIIVVVMFNQVNMVQVKKVDYISSQYINGVWHNFKLLQFAGYKKLHNAHQKWFAYAYRVSIQLHGSHFNFFSSSLFVWVSVIPCMYTCV